MKDLPLVADPVLNANPLARGAVVSSPNIRQEGLFAEVSPELLTREECEDFVKLMCLIVSITDERSWPSTTVHGNRFMGTVRLDAFQPEWIPAFSIP
jgi:hypothetical protein